jgi:hypothetical protein
LPTLCLEDYYQHATHKAISGVKLHADVKYTRNKKIMEAAKEKWDKIVKEHKEFEVMHTSEFLRFLNDKLMSKLSNSNIDDVNLLDTIKIKDAKFDSEAL